MVFILSKLQVTYLCERLFCCFHRSSDDDSPIRYESYSQNRDTSSVDPETRRQLQAEAAERRLAESSTRGIADPESVRRKQERAEEIEKMQYASGKSDNKLQWNVN
uniref:Small VCP/p97-interacting protein n=1 Tax=Trichobilharzia regenti TaxID=157069 RepID=A0AA85K4S4_TRIRE|nr:unnamed protein product [Trichobilharzia regenti]